MKQLLQDLRTGKVELAEVPRPLVRPGHILVASTRTLVSPGTERMLVDFGKAGWIEKARQQPEKVRQVLQKVRAEGLRTTVEAVLAKLDQPLPLGYCNCGTVLEIGDGVNGFAPGDRLVSNGPHAEVVCVPVNLCAKVPDGVSDDEAAFTVLSAVALQGVRLAAPTLGETFVVIGLGLIGMLTAQLLRASGCNVVGVDISSSMEKLAIHSGVNRFVNASMEDPVEAAMSATGGIGADGVIIAAATKRSGPVSQAAKMCRKRGRIILVGVSGMELSRQDFYEKELFFQVSCSYGPGRYDPRYEEGGNDYPIGFVRWTEGRNFSAVLDMMASGRLDAKVLIGRKVPLAEAPTIYDNLSAEGGRQGIVIVYPDAFPEETETAPFPGGGVSSHPVAMEGSAGIGFAGAGNFASRFLLPCLKATKVRLVTIVSGKGVTAAHAAKRFGFESASTDYAALLANPAVNTVFIATRHNLHAEMAVAALRAGKHVFVEKPLALNQEQMDSVARAYEEACRQRTVQFMVGFNRRFSPLVARIKSLLSGVPGPKVFSMTVNAGSVPSGHWIQDPEVGGGRIVGEGCHFVDLLRYLAGFPIAGIQAASVGGSPSDGIREDKAIFTLRFSDGSLGTVQYLANGHINFPKERLEVFCAGRILVLDNFRRLTGFGWQGFRRERLWRQDKGHTAEVAAFLSLVERGGDPLIPFGELLEVTRATFTIAGMVRNAK